MANYPRELNSLCISLNSKYRSHIEIVALILDALRFNESGRYSLMKNTSVNYSQLKKYLKFLSKVGFIETSIRGSSVFYRTSDSGIAYLRQYCILRDMLVGVCPGNRQVGMAVQRLSPPFVTHLKAR
jgi:predicted transcriptional regulator